MKRIVIISGEISGDTHAAELMREVIAQAPGTKFLGLGGPTMKAVADGIEDWVADAAVVGSAIIERIAANLDEANGARPGLVAAVHGLVAELAAGVRGARRA